MALVEEQTRTDQNDLADERVHSRTPSVWEELALAERLSVLRAFRQRVAAEPCILIDAISSDLHRTRADSFAAELLPLLAACRFLEDEAGEILRERRPAGRKPFWLGGVRSAVERVPHGTILVIAPYNYPLFLPGVQVLQALVAGNAVIWKPGRGGEPAARAFLRFLESAGLPAGQLRVTDESIESGIRSIHAGVDKVFFTGSGSAGRAVLALAAQTATPVVAELSGCDAVFVLPGADSARVADALTFGMRLNGSATCMAPRRLMLIGPGHQALLASLQQQFSAIAPVALAPETLGRLRTLVADAAASGATVVGDLRADRTAPVLILGACPEMALAQADLFAPVLSVMTFDDQASALAADRLCPFGLTSSVFGPEAEALRFGKRLTVGTVLINDLIVPTADPRVPFGGRRGSGFGVTRGAEGLLEMTAPRTILVRRGRDRRHFQPTGPAHEQLFQGVLSATHARGWRARMQGLRQVVQAARSLTSPGLQEQQSQHNHPQGSKS